MKIKNFKTFKKIASAEVFFNVFSCIKSRYIYAKEKKFILGKTRSAGNSCSLCSRHCSKPVLTFVSPLSYGFLILLNRAPVFFLSV